MNEATNRSEKQEELGLPFSNNKLIYWTTSITTYSEMLFIAVEFWSTQFDNVCFVLIMKGLLHEVVFGFCMKQAKQFMNENALSKIIPFVK